RPRPPGLVPAAGVRLGDGARPPGPLPRPHLRPPGGAPPVPAAWQPAPAGRLTRPAPPGTTPWRPSTDVPSLASKIHQQEGGSPMSVATTTLPVALRRFIDEVINGQHLAVLDEIMTPDYTNHVAPPELPRGPQGEKLFAQGFLAAFPDTRLTVEDAVATGER